MSDSKHPVRSYMGRPIPESVQFEERIYVFDRIAPYVDDGFPLDRLRANELLVKPNLIYRHKK